MIAQDQPTIFGSDVICAISSVQDGNMKFGRGNDAQTFENRLSFLRQVGVDPRQTTLVQVVYGEAEHFARYHIVTDGHKSLGMLRPESDLVADALVATQPDHAVFLPLADCVGVVLHDEAKKLLMVSHVGRHSAEIGGAKRSVEYLQQKFATSLADLKIWLSPAVGKATYPLHAMNSHSLHEVVLDQLDEAGVPRDHLEVSQIDTAHDENYFSHSRFLKGEQEVDGRFSIVAMMIARGETATNT